MEFYTISLPDVMPVKTISASATHGIGFPAAFLNGLCMLLGLPNNMYTQQLKKSEALAMENLTQLAESIGADGVMDMRCQVDGLTFFVSGTAYVRSAAKKAACKHDKAPIHEADKKVVGEADEKPVLQTDEAESSASSLKKGTYRPPSLAWEELKSVQGNKIGRCSVCGKKRQPIVFTEFEDQFGKGRGELCFECFKDRCK